MKLQKWEQDIIYYVTIVIFAITWMTFNGEEISWSENALRLLNSFLNAGLAGIMAIFIITQYEHPRRDDVVFRWFSKELRFKWFCSFIAKGFFAILIFSLNSFLPEWLHMVATGASVIGLVFLVSGWYKTWSFRWWVFTLAIVLSGVALAIAFAFRTIDVKFPEFALAVTGLIFLASIRNEK